MRLLLFSFLFFTLTICTGQYKNNIWIFGEGCKIDFLNSSSPIVSSSQCVNRCTSCSVADSNGNLICYAYSGNFIQGFYKYTCVRNNYNNIINEGDSINGVGLEQEIIMLPSGGKYGNFLLFTIGITNTFKGLNYCKVDMTANNDTGKVIKKNKFIHNTELIEGINAIKNGNGKDWWVLTHRSDSLSMFGTNTWYTYLVGDTGILRGDTQYVGTINTTNAGATAVSLKGDKIAFVNNRHLIDVFDFDRCSGTIASFATIQSEIIHGGDEYIGVEFSPNGKVLYTSNYTNQSIYQFNLDTPAQFIALTKKVIYQDTSSAGLIFGQLKLAPDNKIYFTRWGCTHLGVIYNPDVLGLGCNFYPDTFYLGGNISNLSLPNNPNYELGPDTGSTCDTLGLGIAPPPKAAEGVIAKCFPNPSNGILHLEFISTSNYEIEIQNSIGEVVFQSTCAQCKIFSANLSFLKNGVYSVTAFTKNKKVGVAKLAIVR